VGGHDAVARLVAVDAAHVGGQTDRTADVGTELERGQPGGEGGRRPARRTTGRAVEVPRVAGRAEHLVVALHVAGVDRQVRLAPDDRAGPAQPGHRGRVLGRDVVGQLGCAGRGAHPGRAEAVLDGHRHAVQRAELVAPGDGGVGRGGCRLGGVEVAGDDAVERAVEAIGPGDGVVQRLTTGHLATPDGGRQFDGGQLVQLGHGRLLPNGPGAGACPRAATIRPRLSSPPRGAGAAVRAPGHRCTRRRRCTTTPTTDRDRALRSPDPHHRT
jgi:hypothetical protein